MPCHNRVNQRHRVGSFIVEAVVAVALLATALVAVARFASSAESLERQADRWTAANLAGQNAIERFRHLPANQWQEQRAAIADEVALSTGCGINVRVQPMERPAGLHLSVTVSSEDEIEITVHDWWLESPETKETDGERDQPADNPEGSQ